MIKEMELITCVGRQGRKIILHEGGKALEQVVREVVEPFKTCLHMALSNLLLLDLFEHVVALAVHGGLFQPA